MAMCSTNAGVDGDGYLGCTNPEACNYDEELVTMAADVPFQGCQECVVGFTPIDSNDDGINDCEEVPVATIRLRATTMKQQTLQMVLASMPLITMTVLVLV